MPENKYNESVDAQYNNVGSIKTLYNKFITDNFAKVGEKSFLQ